MIGEQARVVFHQRQALVVNLAKGMRNDNFDGAEGFLSLVVVVVQRYTRLVVIANEVED